jgi:hypothetical protein
MAVLFYQIGIFLAIIIASKFGQKSRNTAVILISIFTVLQVFVSWLLILQFVTILIAYQFSNSILHKDTNKESSQNSDRISFSDYGLSKNNPILLIDIATSYRFINQLNTLNNELSYKKKGSIQSAKFKNMIDMYEFRKDNIFFCTVYVYPYALQNIIEIPKPFQKI